MALDKKSVNVLGAIIGGAGVLGAISAWNKFPTYPNYSEQIDNILARQKEVENKQQAEFSAAWAGYADKVKGEVSQGLQARGITDPSVKKAALSQTEDALSNAYSVASEALSRAKVTAGNQLSQVVGNYNQTLAGNALKSQIQKAYAEAGIWGALGGLGGGLVGMDLNKPKVPKTEIKKYPYDPVSEIKNKIAGYFGEGE